MEAIILVIIFIIGATFGSFLTLATYRIPKHQDITHTRSYCPRCNHKLGFFDMLPIFSYIFLGGKCRYCKKKISPRYLIIEVLAGISFVALFKLIKIDVYNITITQVIEYFLFALYFVFLFLTAGIDKENRQISKGVCVYGILLSIIYIVYLCIVEKANIYRYAIYIVFYILVLILDTITLKKFAKNKYINGLLLILITMAIFTQEYASILTIACTALIVAFYMLINKMKKTKNRRLKTEKQIGANLPIAFYLSIANILMLFYVVLLPNIK